MRSIFRNCAAVSWLLATWVAAEPCAEDPRNPVVQQITARECACCVKMDDLIRRHEYVYVLFYASHASRINSDIAFRYETLYEEWKHTKIVFGKVDVNMDKEIADPWVKPGQIPTNIIFRNGQPVVVKTEDFRRILSEFQGSPEGQRWLLNKYFADPERSFHYAPPIEAPKKLLQLVGLEKSKKKRASKKASKKSKKDKKGAEEDDAVVTSSSTSMSTADGVESGSSLDSTSSSTSVIGSTSTSSVGAGFLSWVGFFPTLPESDMSVRAFREALWWRHSQSQDRLALAPAHMTFSISATKEVLGHKDLGNGEGPKNLLDQLIVGGSRNPDKLGAVALVESTPQDGGRNSKVIVKQAIILPRENGRKAIENLVKWMAQSEGREAKKEEL